MTAPRFLALCASALLLVPGASGNGKKRPPWHPVNINTANSAELQEVPGIGPSTAEKILKMRKAHGPFRSVDELLAIKGIGKKRLAKWRPYLTVGEAAEKPARSSEGKKEVHFQRR
jgi:competence protein ComEA